MATYYIVTKSNWQNDDWSLAAGPFKNRVEACLHLEEYEVHDIQECGGIDLKSETHAKIVSKSALKMSEEEIVENLYDIFLHKEEHEKLERGRFGIC